MTVQQRRAIVIGVLFVILGLLFFLEAVELFEIAPTTLWPVLLIALGIGVLAGIGDNDEDPTPGSNI
jgi:hypothetical protein